MIMEKSSFTNISLFLLLLGASGVLSGVQKDKVNDNDSKLLCFAQEPINDNSLTFGPREISRTLIEGSHSFAFDLIKALSKFEAKETSPGILVSPSSIWSALIVTNMGTVGDTDKELKSVLRIKKIPKSAAAMAFQGLKFWSEFKKNATKTNKTPENAAFTMANKIFFDKNLRLNKCIEDHFGSDVKKMDFSNKPRQSLETINNWVKDQTRGKIVDLIPSEAITPWTKMILANAVYFQSKWLNQFDKENTKTLPFHVSPTEEVQAKMMSQHGTFMYGISERLQVAAIELPYADAEYSMIILLPEAGRGLDALIRAIKPIDLYQLVTDMYDDEVYVVLPKFRVNQQFELAGPLYSMGVRKLFDPRFVDLSGFFDNTNQTSQPVVVNSVVHKTFINVDEEGTEAAAATALVYGRSGRPVFPTQFVANRPFLYLIRDTNTNFILFMGTVRRPQE